MESSSQQDTPGTIKKRQLQLEAQSNTQQTVEQMLLSVSKKTDKNDKKQKVQKDKVESLIKQTLADL